MNNSIMRSDVNFKVICWEIIQGETIWLPSLSSILWQNRIRCRCVADEVDMCVGAEVRGGGGQGTRRQPAKEYLGSF